MKKYFVLYLAPVAAIDQLMAEQTPESMKEGMDKWNAWQKEHAEHVVEPGAPLGKTKRVMEAGVYDTRNDVTGYAIVQAKSHEEAAKMFVGHPHFEVPGSSIDVLEIVAMPGE